MAVQEIREYVVTCEFCGYKEQFKMDRADVEYSRDLYGIFPLPMGWDYISFSKERCLSCVENKKGE